MTMMTTEKKTLILGASTKPSRYSFIALQRLLENGHPVVAVGRRAAVLDEVEIVAHQKHFEEVHTVTLYLNPTHQADYYEYILSLQPKRVIFNPGTENPEFMKRLDANGIAYEAACTLVLLGTDQY